MGGALSNSRAEAELDTLDFERRQAKREEVERKQNNSMTYVTANIYSYAPVRVRRQHVKVYVSLDVTEVKRQELELRKQGKQSYDIVKGRPTQTGPDEVVIDEGGNIKLNYKHDTLKTRSVKRDSVTGLHL